MPKAIADDIQLKGNVLLNPHRDDWLKVWSALCMEAGGFDEAAWREAFDDILAASDVIRYTSLGNPESIVNTDGRVDTSVEDAMS